MKLQSLFITCFLTVSIVQINAQKAPSAIVAANKKYEKLAYIDAIKTYERVAEKGYKSVEMFQKLGNSYYFNADLEKAGKWYAELFAMNRPVEAEYYYRYSQCLKAMGNYIKADAVMTQFNTKSGNDERAILFEKNKNYLEDIKFNSGRFNIDNAGINSEYSDYGSTIANNRLVFASAREVIGVSKKVMQWTGQSFTNLFSVELKPDGTFGPAEKIDKGLNSKFNESTPVFTKDGKYVYFTRNNFNNGKRQSDEKRNTLLKLYKATKKGDKWKNITELPFNSNLYSVAHPALSPDEKVLYFASDMPGSLGQSDLYKANINDDGSLDTPINLGKEINTPGRETFPYVTENNELFFATDGRPGLGGLDVFVSQLTDDGIPGTPINIGAPINGKTDDFGFIIDGKTRKGFFTSNREGGVGNDDIYKFLEIKKLECEQSLSGVVVDAKTLDLLPQSEVILLDSKFKEIQKVFADDKANYKFSVVCGETYYVRANKKDYETSEQKLTISKTTGKTDLTIQLDKKVVPVKTDDDIAKALGIKMIYFDLDKSYIRQDAALELEKILDVMNTNPTMVIDVRSHTDSRQTAAYNLALSSRRAKSTVAWLVKNGIKPNRLSSKGYGESKLAIPCPDGVECTEEQHQLNRRSEFIITSM
ncbi:MAG: OmpA family protein [Flavobacterium sp.]|nr:OmpA family protein [Flavobacterium sp.]